MPDIVFEHVHKRYGDHEAIHDLSLEIRDGEFFVILGESGAGKTTTLKMLAGVEPVTSGTILLDGRPIQNLTPEERDCAMVFESYALYPHLSVHENIAFPLRAPGRQIPKDQIDESVLRAARMLGIDLYLDRKPGALSGGQRQRVALGRALVRRPAVFLLDEPLSHLDARLRNKMRTEIKTMRESFGTTIVYVTHDYSEALALGDRIAILHQGRVEQVGTPTQVYHRPRNRRVAESLGDPPMNFLPGKLTLNADGPMFEAAVCRIPLLASPHLQKSAGREVCMGIRPQHLRLERTRHNSPFNLLSKVFVCELLGDRAVVSVEVASRLFMVLCAPDQAYGMDEPVYLTWAPEHMYLFLEGSGETILGELSQFLEQEATKMGLSPSGPAGDV
jgi:multiple sugar transport system ATP-binding protein